jgi:hypothetical protein
MLTTVLHCSDLDSLDLLRHHTTRTGVSRSVVVPSPSWPISLSPQQ